MHTWQWTRRSSSRIELKSERPPLMTQELAVHRRQRIGLEAHSCSNSNPITEWALLPVAHYLTPLATAISRGPQCLQQLTLQDSSNINTIRMPSKPITVPTTRIWIIASLPRHVSVPHLKWTLPTPPATECSSTFTQAKTQVRKQSKRPVPTNKMQSTPASLPVLSPPLLHHPQMLAKVINDNT